MLTFWCGDSTLPTVDCHASSVFLAPFGAQGFSPTRIQLCIIGVQWISFQILPILRFIGQAYLSPEKLVKWVLLDAQSTCTIVAPPAMWDVPKGTVYIWEYPWSIMFRRCVNDHQSNYHCWAWNRVQQGAFARHLPIEMTDFWWFPVHISDVDPSMFSFADKIIEPDEHWVLNEMDAMYSIVVSTCNASCANQLVCNMLFPMHLLLQLPASELVSLLDQQYRSGQDAGSH